VGYQVHISTTTKARGAFWCLPFPSSPLPHPNYEHEHLNKTSCWQYRC